MKSDAQPIWHRFWKRLNYNQNNTTHRLYGRNRNMMSPEMPSSSGQQRSIDSVIFSPTLNLPNYTINGEAPHLIAQSPKRKLKENVKSDWLTTMRKQKLMNSTSFNRQMNAKLGDSSTHSNHQEHVSDESIISPRKFYFV